MARVVALRPPGERLLVLFRRNGAHLLYCFVGAALLNLLSQSFFGRVAPRSKDAWLSATLLGGTVAAMLGVATAQRFGLGRRSRGAALAIIAATAALFAASLVVATPLAFVIITLAARWFVQYGTQEFDRRAVALAGPADRRLNDLLGVGTRFAGFLAGPLWFALVGDPLAHAAAIALLAALGAWSAVGVTGEPLIDTTRAVEREARGELNRADLFLLAAGRAIYAGYYLLASSLVYLLSDLHRVPSAVRLGGLVITCVYASAVVTTASELSRRRTRPRSLAGMVPAMILLVACGLFIGHPLVGRPPVLLGGAVLLGIGFAQFQLVLRDRASWLAVHESRTAFLASYNNLATTSALLGFAIMTALSWASTVLAVPYARTVGAGLALLGVAALAMARGARPSARRRRAS